MKKFGLTSLVVLAGLALGIGQAKAQTIHLEVTGSHIPLPLMERIEYAVQCENDVYRLTAKKNTREVSIEKNDASIANISGTSLAKFVLAEETIYRLTFNCPSHAINIFYDEVSRAADGSYSPRKAMLSVTDDGKIRETLYGADRSPIMPSANR